jgi:hypothetical protein
MQEDFGENAQKTLLALFEVVVRMIILSSRPHTLRQACSPVENSLHMLTHASISW